MIYLDILSLVDSKFYSKNKRLEWHVPQSEYDEIAGSVYKAFDGLALSNDDLDTFNICRPSIYNALTSYLSHVYDYIVLNRENIEVRYSNESNIYIKKIWENKTIDSIFSLELEKSRFRNNWYKKIYSTFVKYIPKIKFNYIIISKNKLIEEFISEKSSMEFLRVSLPYYFDINLKCNSYINSLAIKISSEVFDVIDSNHFELSQVHKSSIEFIVCAFLSRSYSDMKKYSGFLNGSKSILLGSGANYYNRLISTVIKNDGVDIHRFHHGGERCFYNDEWFWDSEFYLTSVFITYGVKWKEYALENIRRRRLDISVKAVGSKYHRKLFDKYFGKKNYNNKILYIPNSFVGEARQFPYAKIIDPLLFDWQKYLIEILQDNGFEVIYKKHPKGFYQEENILGKIAKYESTSPMIEALKGVDMVLCDMAGSAFIEALCAGKDIVLIDTKQRPFYEGTKSDLQKAVKLVDAYWEDNILKVNETELVSAFRTNDINDEDKKELILDYFLNGEKNDF